MAPPPHASSKCSRAVPSNHNTGIGESVNNEYKPLTSIFYLPSFILNRMPRPFAPKHWRLLESDSQAELTLQTELGVHPTVAALLIQRGVTTPAAADAFLNPSLDRMHDPF